MAKTKQSNRVNEEDLAWIKRVIELADERGVVYRRLTEAAGVEPQRIDKWRRGSAPTLRHLMGIARYLDVSLDWIATGASGGGGETGFPRDEVREDERHLLWMLRSLGITPTDAAARITSVGKPFDFVAEQRLQDSNRDPANPNPEDSPRGRKTTRVKRDRGSV